MTTIYLDKSLSRDIKLATYRARKNRKKAAKKRTTHPRRLGSKAFSELSQQEQNTYLKVFPKSSHRFRTKTAPTKKENQQKVPKERASKETVTKRTPSIQTEKRFKKRLSQEDFALLSKKNQQRYKKEWETALFKRKHPVIKKKNITQQKKDQDVLENGISDKPTESAIKKQKSAKASAVRLEREDSLKSLRHGVTPEAVSALKNISQKDIDEAAKGLASKRKENVESFREHLKQKDRHLTYSEPEIQRLTSKLDGAKQGKENLEEDEVKTAEAYVKTIQPNKPRKTSKKERDLLSRLDKDLAERKEADPQPFWRKDFDAVKKIMSGEPVEPEGKHNAMIALSLLCRYGLMAAAGAAFAMGAAPAGMHIAKALLESWGEFSSHSSDDEDEDDILYAAYDAIADYVKHLDKESFVEDISTTFRKFESTSSGTKLVYRCAPEQIKLPIQQRTVWYAYLHNKCVGLLIAEPSESSRRIPRWKPVLYENSFDPLDYPHVDDGELLREPFVITNDEDIDEHNLELHYPVYLPMRSAKDWISDMVYKSGIAS